MMALSTLAIWLVLVFFRAGFAQNTGRFWHVTDFHYDETYWTTGQSCYENVSDPGQYGDHWCDSPWLLVQDSIAAMAQIADDVDFVIWTGDSVAHDIKGGFLSLDINMEIVRNVTTAMSASFPGVPVFPSLGNHDFFPTSQAFPGEHEVYQRVAEMWGNWIANQTQVELFKSGGYYKTMVGSKIRLLVLNTNLYYTSDKLTGTAEDPADQLQWLMSQLEHAKVKREKVIIIGHVPPGLRTPLMRDWFYPVYQSKFVDIVTQFSDVIVATHFGHEHSDGFKILQTEHGSVTQFTAPSVTPWRYKTQTEAGLEVADPHNPGIRLVEYDKDTGRHLNYHQYYINLTISNNLGQTNWAELYSFKAAYKVDDMSVSSLRKIFSRMQNGGGKEYASKYCSYALVSAQELMCTDEFRAEIYCGGLNYNLTEAKNCKQKYLNSLNTASVHKISSYSMINAVIALGCFVMMLQV